LQRRGEERAIAQRRLQHQRRRTDGDRLLAEVAGDEERLVDR
jgi:hypothetical protein